MKNKKVTAEISVEIPILKNLPYDGMVLNLGALTLTCGKRNFVLDTQSSNYDNEVEAGGKFSFTSQCEVDDSIFEEGEFVNYELTEEDLTSPELQAEFFCGDEDAGIDDAFDFENATIECTVTVNGKEYTINNVKFE